MQSPTISRSSPAYTRHSLPIVTSGTGFVFPDIYSWPPFFTKQPRPQVANHQVKLWKQLILSYCRYHRLSRLEITQGAITTGGQSDLWGNTQIDRRLTLARVHEIIELMVISGSAEYDTQPSKGRQPTGALVYWRRPEEWGEIIYHWVVENGLTGSILTFYELTQGGDLAASTEFYNIPYSLLRKALQSLNKQNKAQVFKGTDDGDGDNDGVKFV